MRRTLCYNKHNMCKQGVVLNFPYQYKSENEMQTERLGAAFAAYVLKHRIAGKCTFVALQGDLGAGKTAFVRGAVGVLCAGARVQSPSYTVVNEYRGDAIPIFHFDVYRLETEDDLYSIGFFDYLEEDALCFCEWSEKISAYIPQHRYTVLIRKSENESERAITISEEN